MGMMREGGRGMSRVRGWGEMRRWSWGNGEEAKGGEPKVEAGGG